MPFTRLFKKADRVKDLFKRLYQNLVPKRVRHDLGEYFTPDWLAELVLKKVGYDGDLEKRVLDPACGSGTFLVLVIKEVKNYAEEHFVTGLIISNQGSSSEHPYFRSYL